MTMSKKNETKINQRIEYLQRQSDLVREEMELEVLSAKKRITDIGKIALGIGGGLVFSAILLRSIFQKKSEGTSESPRRTQRVYHKFKDQLVGELSHQALLFILGVAKDKIRAHLQHDTSYAERKESEITD